MQNANFYALFLVSSLIGCQSGVEGPTPPDGTSSPTLSAMPQVDAPDGNFSGVVAERRIAGTYAYMRVRTETGHDEWVVTLGGGKPAGTAVSVTNIGIKTQFRSRRLGTTFERLVFGIVRDRG